MSACRVCHTTLLTARELCPNCTRWRDQEQRLNAYRAGFVAAERPPQPSRLQRPLSTTRNRP